MLNLRNKSVNVDRLHLLQILKQNLQIHSSEYAEAINDYRKRLKSELVTTLNDISSEDISEQQLLAIKIDFNAPISHIKDYMEIIEMLELSVDNNINLDSESFKAYVKNDWPWTSNFKALMLANKMYLNSAA